MKQKILDKIENYRRQREELVRRANEQIAAWNGAIEALEDLLREEEAPVETEVPTEGGPIEEA